MRGEDLSLLAICGWILGSPPHARGRLWSRSAVCGGLVDHPRMRGEDLPIGLNRWPIQGSPPHARGRPSCRIWPSTTPGITPACAGKTGAVALRHAPWTDHPRMRGEDLYDAVVKLLKVGSPPHARGRRVVAFDLRLHRGITPACAGKTASNNQTYSGGPDHPRMRGEDVTSRKNCAKRVGSPPHARGRPLRCRR